MTDRLRTTIIAVADEPEEWTSKDGSFSGVNAKVIFANASTGFVSTKPEFVQKHIDALKKLIGQEVELEGEDRGQFGFKITEYPGKPTGAGGGGKVNPAVYQSQNALLAAAYTVGPGGNPEDVLVIAENVYMPWLKKWGGGSGGEGQGPANRPAASDPVVDSGGTQAPGIPLAMIRTLRSLADQLGWSETEACEKAGVAYFGELNPEEASRLLVEWNTLLVEKEEASA